LIDICFFSSLLAETTSSKTDTSRLSTFDIPTPQPLNRSASSANLNSHRKKNNPLQILNLKLLETNFLYFLFFIFCLLKNSHFYHFADWLIRLGGLPSPPPAHPLILLSQPETRRRTSLFFYNIFSSLPASLPPSLLVPSPLLFSLTPPSISLIKYFGCVLCACAFNQSKQIRYDTRIRYLCPPKTNQPLTPTTTTDYSFSCNWDFLNHNV
jgi:hypothetical protein